MNKNLYPNLFDKLPDAYLVIENGLFIDGNTAAQQLLKISIEQLKALKPQSVLSAFNHIDELSASKIETLRLSTQLISSEMHLPDGTSTNVTIKLIVVSEEENCILLQIKTSNHLSTNNSANEINKENSFHTFERKNHLLTEKITTSNKIHFNSLLDLEVVLNFYTSESIEPIRNAYFKCLENGTSYDFELQTLTVDGKKTWVHTSGRAMRDGMGTITNVHGYVQNINEDKRIEESIQKAQQLIHTIFEQSPIGIALVNPTNGKILEVNAVFSSIIGRSPEELKNIDWMSMTHPDDFEEDLKNMLKLNKAEISKYNLNKRYIKPDNTVVWVRMTVTSFLSKGNEQPLYLCMIEDMTEAMKKEEALRESEQNFRLLFENGPIAITYHQLIYNETQEPIDFVCIEANKTYKEYIGFDPVGQQDGQMDTAKKNNNENWINRFKEVRKTGKVQRFQEYIETNDRWYDCAVFQYKKDHFVAAFLEITKQKQAEIKLTESQNLYHSFVEHLPGAVFRKNSEGRYIFVNNKFCEVKGMTPEQVIGKTPRELSDYEKSINSERMKTGFKQSTLLEGDDHHKYIMRTGDFIENEEVYIRPDGSKRYFQVVKSPVFGFDGNIIGSQGIQFDITDRKNAESALIENNNRLALAMKVANMAWWEMDLTTGKIWFEKRKAEMLGFTSERFNHYNDFMQLVHPDDYQKTMQSMHSHLVGTKEKYEVEYRIRDIDNKYKYFYDIGSITKFDSNGKPLLVSGLILDITERKHSEDALLKSEMFLRTFINNVPFQIWARDDNNIGILENKHFVENFGSILGKKPGKGGLLSDELTERWYKYTNRVLKGEVIDEEVTILKEDVRIEQQQIIFPIKANAKIIGTAGFIIDITERKLVQEALRDSQEQLKNFAAHLQNVREEERILLAREIHDELGQILVAIKIDLGLLKHKVFDNIDRKKDIELKMLYEHLSNLVGNTIKTSRRIMTDLRPELLDILGLVDAMRSHANSFQERHSIECVFESAVQSIDIDAQRSVAIFRILQESLTNIAKHAMATQVSIRLGINEKDRLFLEIKDNGKGFDLEKKRKNESYGLIGMKERAYLLGGDLFVLSSPGKGTTVRIEMDFPK